MPYDINSQQVDIENLFKQNVNDLASIKELYRKLKEMEEKISQIKYIDSNLADKLKKDYEKLLTEITNDYSNLKRIILDENIQAKLTNDINVINSQMETKTKEIEVERKRIDSFTTLAQGSTTGDAELIDGRVDSDGIIYTNIGGAIRSKANELDIVKNFLFNNSSQNIIKISGNCFETSTGTLHHLNTCLTCDISNISTITSIEINYDIAFNKLKPLYFSTKYRTTNGTMIQVNNIDNISIWNRFNNINIKSNSYTKTSDVFQIYIYPCNILENNYMEYYIKNLSVKINGETIPYTLSFPQLTNVNYEKSSNVKYDDFKNLQDFVSSSQSNILYNKTLLVIGDSISTPNTPNYTNKHYYDYLAENEKMNVITDAFIGTGYCTTFSGKANFLERIEQQSGYNPDYIIIFGGTNDWFEASLPLGNYTDTETTSFCGCVYNAILKLMNKYPLAKILLANPIRRNILGNNSNGETLMQYAKAVKDVANNLGVNCIDLYNESGLNPQIPINKNTYFATNDNTHPNDKGQLKIYPCFKEGLLRS